MAKSTNKKKAPPPRIGKKRSINKTPKSLAASPEVLDRLWVIIHSRKGVDTTLSHSAKLLARGTPQVVQKLGEELIECLIEAMAGNHAGLVTESADVLYHLLVTWVNAGIRPEEVWAELVRREEVSHLTEGVPLKQVLAVGTTKIP